MTRHLSALSLVAALALATPALADDTPDFAQDLKPLKISIGDDGTQWLRIINWLQVWTRLTEQNPGTTVGGEAQDLTFDVALRRARLMLWSQLGPRLSLMFHFGINNQTFNGAAKPQLFVHDAWAEIEAVPGALAVAAGLLYWNGVSRLANTSTLNMLALDAPIVNWHQLEKADQFGRQLGLYAKGKIDLFDYRLALTRPFTFGADLVDGGPVEFRKTANTVALAGYFQFQFDETESNALPYMAGTYLGKKSVFNLGLGFHWQPDALGELDGTEVTKHDLLALGADLFLDQPLGAEGAALTGYLGYYLYDYGPDYVRNVGVMNVGAGGTSLNGAGNAYPLLGTGSHLYTQWGLLLPGQGVRLQPYVTAQASFIERLDDPVLVFEAGANLYLSGHNAKLTLNWRSRPVFQADADGVFADSRANELILQLALMR